ncbi:High affinity cAMP-specific and IBMX-insensitive 3',5'-cyclic phosphodiesterase 9A [Mortierella hygrophila]|uniref:Phosphodiesterase n=1 Tax=Mortierella hygrophila TaxID=979708 RepID=A0A9P6EZN4_9FUNG|nr:High affinity cAMP-specific and IBMX-insensitive 3',5'-cyclic phosphodiesterase 9A [Mortierella hygrophila]
MLRFISGKSKPMNQDFNVWDHTLPEIYGIILAMFVKLDLVKCLNITEGELLDFIIDVDRGYLATYYHSFFHAADVTAVLYRILLDMNASQYLSKPDMAALLLAGLCHDIGHPGLNNLFQVNAKTDLVKQHGETSVLEKYSCSLAMDLIDKHKLFRNIASSPAGILPEGNHATEQSMKESMVKAIMATDMSFHYDMLNNLNSLIEFTSTPSSSPSSSDAENESDLDHDSAPSSPTDMTIPSSLPTPSTTTTTTNESLQTRLDGAVCHHSHSHCHSTPNHRRQSSASSTSSDCSDVSVDSDTSSQTSRSITGASYRSASELTPELRQNLSNCLLHAADISNAVKPWTLCKRWSDLVVQEFFRQGDIERTQHLPISPNMDRVQHHQPQISLGFSDFVVRPYFESFVEFLPEASPFLVALTNNREQWVLMQKAVVEAEKEQSSGAVESSPITNGETDAHVNVDTSAPDSAAETKDLQRVNSPLPAHLTSGRRVSVAAGVLVLDETRPIRPPPRRLRHSTNAEGSQGHIRKMKRSHSGRALSSCLRDLHVLHPRSIQAVGKTVVSQEAIVTALKREVALAGKETSVNLTSVSNGTTPGGSPTGHAEALPMPSSALDPGFATKLSIMIGTSLPKHSENTTPQPPSPQPAQYRRRRHGSLQIGTEHQSIRQEYGDRYIIFNDENHSSGRMWDQRDCEDQHHDHGVEGWNGNAEHIPSGIHSAFPNSRHALLPPYSYPHPHQPFTASTTPQSTGPATFTTAAAAARAPQAAEPMKIPEQVARFQPGESPPPASAALSLASGLANNINVRSSTPAVMSGQIQYDWSRPPLPPTVLPQEVNGGGYGPLDHVVGQHEDLAPAAAAASVPILTSLVLSPLLTIQTAAATSATTSSSWDSKSDPVVDKTAAALPVEDLRVSMTESADGPMGCVVGQTTDLPMGATTPTNAMASKPKVVSRADASDGVVSLSAASSSVSTTATTTTL